MNGFFSALRVKNANPVMSFENLHRSIGVLGMALPLICFLGGLLVMGLKLGPSISSYYYTNVRDAFEGILVCVGLFLITYRGYERIDDIVSTSTGVFGFGIALFPCFNNAVKNTGFLRLDIGTSNTLHIICAGTFFFLLAVNSIFIFTLTDGKKKPTRKKKIRNGIYIVSGLVIIACLILSGILHFAYGQDYLDTKTWVFILETILLEAFGISWLVKGKTLFRD